MSWSRWAATTIAIDADFDAATPVGLEPLPEPMGTFQGMRVEGLSPDTTYFFALKTRDWEGNISGLSNSVSATTAVPPPPPPADSDDDGCGCAPAGADKMSTLQHSVGAALGYLLLAFLAAWARLLPRPQPPYTATAGSPGSSC